MSGWQPSQKIPSKRPGRPRLPQFLAEAGVAARAVNVDFHSQNLGPPRRMTADIDEQRLQAVRQAVAAAGTRKAALTPVPDVTDSDSPDVNTTETPSDVETSGDASEAEVRARLQSEIDEIKAALEQERRTLQQSKDAYAERVSTAVSALRLTSERLAEQARSDALEIALALCRRLLGAELQTSVEPLFSLIRETLGKVGKCRKVVIRLSPRDKERVDATSHGGLQQDLSIAQIDYQADPNLTEGDVVVDTDFGLIDGRLESRLAHLRKVLTDVFTDAPSSPIRRDEE